MPRVSVLKGVPNAAGTGYHAATLDLPYPCRLLAVEVVAYTQTVFCQAHVLIYHNAGVKEGSTGGMKLETGHIYGDYTLTYACDMIVENITIHGRCNLAASGTVDVYALVEPLPSSRRL